MQLRPAGDRAGAGNQPHAADRERFRSRFGNVAVLHSHLSDAERHWHWERIADGEVSVVVGARSAVFAPTPHLGLIVLDEEHETSFKQEIAPRYTPATWRWSGPAAERIPLVLGSATPSLESWHRAQHGRVPAGCRCRGACSIGRCRRWARSICAPNFATATVRGAISRPLHPAMDAALHDGGQVILLLNRRGFSTHIQCPACGIVVRVPALRDRADASSHRQIALVPLLRLSGADAARVPRVPLRGHSLSAAWARSGSRPRSRPGFPSIAACGWTPTPCRSHGSHERALDGVSRRQGADSAGHADDRQGARFSQRHAGRRDQCRHGAAPARLPRRGADVSAGHAGGRPHGPRRRRAAACWCRRSAPSIRRFRPPCGTTTQRSPARNCPSAQMLGYPPFASMIRLVVRGPVRASSRRVRRDDRGRGAGSLGEGGRRGSRPGPGAGPDCQTARPVSVSYPSPRGRRRRPTSGRPLRRQRPQAPRNRPVDRRRRSDRYAVKKRMKAEGRRMKDEG